MSRSAAGTERARPTATSTKAVRLIHAAALAAVLVPLGSVAVETATITCTSPAGGSSGAGCSGLGGYTASGSGIQSNTWKFFDDGVLKYTLQIAGDPTSNFSLDAIDFVTTQNFLDDTGALANFPTAVCIPTFDAGQCGLFRVFEVGGTASWVNGYVLTITWFTNSDPLSNPTSGRNTILQAHGSSSVFGNELANIIFDPNPTPTDPGISGRGDDFSTFGAFNVPEPGSLALLGMGVAGLLHRVRRRKSNR